MKKAVYEHMSQQTGDAIMEWKKCPWSGDEFAIYAGDVALLEKLSPLVLGNRYLLPLPIHSSEVRMTQRLAVRNNRYLYKRTCALTGKPTIALYSPDKPYTVYSHTAWNSDAWDACVYGKEFDEQQSFFKQFHDLQLNVPRMASYVDTSCTNCDYANGVTNAKNCYLSDTCSWNEDIWYCSWVINCTQVMDCYKCEHLEHSYACVLCQRSSGLQYCIDCHDTTHCAYSVGLRSCHHCFGCSNLAHKSYCIFNQQVTKEEYETFYTEQQFGSHIWRVEQRKRFLATVWNNAYHPTVQIIGSEKCLGNDISDAMNCWLCYNIVGAQDCRYCTDFSPTVRDCLDCSYAGHDVSKNYFTFSGLGHNLLGCMYAWHSNDCMYCDSCMNCSFCFGCIGLKNKQYCILNVQYTKETYFEKVAEIIAQMQQTGEWGQFFPPACAPFAYNETVAHEYVSLTKEEAVGRGYTWQDTLPSINLPEGVTPSLAQELPDDIGQIDDSIAQKVLVCAESGKPYRIVSSELAFYRKHTLPIPRVHYDVRYAQKKQFVAGRELLLRDVGGEKLLSVYPEHTQGVIVSPEQYEQMMFG